MEDFVTFEIAKKLKEKGFDHPCIGHYVNSQLYVAHYQNAFHSDNDESVDAPTISQVLKWLRKAWKVVVTPEYLFTEYDDWDFNIRIIGRYGEYESDEMYSSYEEAALAGIEYVLDNLI